MSNNQNCLELKNAVKRYGEKIALNHVNLALKPGIYGLLGQNGAGKTTLIHILAGILKADEGQVLYNGEDIIRMQERYRTNLGYMPQTGSTDIDCTVIGFLRYMAALKKIQEPETVIRQLIKHLHLKEYRNFRLSQLSGGTKQRVLIAQSLLNDPKLLLLDEPTAGLDPVERKNLRSIIADCGKDKIVLLATHVISDVEFIADTIILMKEGRILSMDDQADLMKQTAVFETDEDIAEVLKHDPSVRIINRHYREGKMYMRYLSKHPTERSKRVETTLDDVYLDWLDTDI